MNNNETKKIVSTSIAFSANLILEDDMKLLYKVVDVLPNSMIVEVFPNRENFGCEVITYKTFFEEGWKIIGKAY